jgi:16S rRNA (guanine527-N7)-methyltransferase
MVVQHLADCLAVVQPMRREASSLAGQTLLDVGSGGGLPGVVLAVMNPELRVTCVDAVGKKVAFVRQVAGSLGLKNLAALHCRIEALQAPPYDLVTSRAFSSLSKFVAATGRLLSPSGVWMAMKGKVPRVELEELPTGVLFHVEQLQVPWLPGERCLVWMRRGGETPASL